MVLRGRQLREATILRFFAVERWVRAFVLLLLGYAVLKFRTSEQSLQQTFDRVLPAAQPLAKAFDLNINNSPTIARIHRLLETDPGTLAWIAVALFVYAGIQVAEGVGLWSLKRWGEYLAVVATSIFLPVEIYELHERVTVAPPRRVPGQPRAGRLPRVEQAALRGAWWRRRRTPQSGTRTRSCPWNGPPPGPPSVVAVYGFLAKPRWIGATLVTLLAIAAFIGLGSWQWHRAKTRDTPHAVNLSQAAPIPVSKALGSSTTVEPGTPVRATSPPPATTTGRTRC